MLKAEVDTLVMTIRFLNDKWEPYHITFDFFETVDTFGNAMALHVNDVLAKYGFNAQIIAYVKNESCNFNTMTNALTSTISYETLSLQTPFVGSCWGHAMSKCIQYATDDAKVSTRLTFVSINEA
jgi:hypothetical protein